MHSACHYYTHLFLSLLHILLYTPLSILGLWADGGITEEKINLTKCSFLCICIQHIAVSTCWFCLNRMRASWTMYFLSVFVSSATPVCACQVRAMRNNLAYNDKTVLRVAAIIKATKQKWTIEKLPGWTMHVQAVPLITWADLYNSSLLCRCFCV